MSKQLYAICAWETNTIKKPPTYKQFYRSKTGIFTKAQVFIPWEDSSSAEAKLTVSVQAPRRHNTNKDIFKAKFNNGQLQKETIKKFQSVSFDGGLWRAYGLREVRIWNATRE